LPNAESPTLIPTMSSFEKMQTEDRRLTILSGLAASTQLTANGYLLQAFCDTLGHRVGHERIAGDIEWLREQGLVTVSSTGQVVIATLTARGQDVANGRSHCPGVKTPSAGA
jgi:hypothetical protein